MPKFVLLSLFIMLSGCDVFGTKALKAEIEQLKHDVAELKLRLETIEPGAQKADEVEKNSKILRSLLSNKKEHQLNNK